jgi:hypothetical protein
MILQDVSLLLLIWFVTAFGQVLATSIDPRLCFLSALACGFLYLLRPFVKTRFLQRPEVFCVLIGIFGWTGLALSAIATGSWAPGFELSSPLLSLLVACGIEVTNRVRNRQCALCKRRELNGVLFKCPRCGLEVCENGCWNFEHLRCELCLELNVPILPPDARWWNRQFGPPFKGGHCQLCLVDGTENPLRTCPRCGRPQCTSCWDTANAQCKRCGWIAQELPESLGSYVVSSGRELTENANHKPR